MGLIQKTIDAVSLVLCWFFGLFAVPEEPPRITKFRWISRDFNLAEAVLSWGDGDVRNVYSDRGRWYYLGRIPVDNERLLRLLAEREALERQRIQQRRVVGLA